jgi:hypothetical protein
MRALGWALYFVWAALLAGLQGLLTRAGAPAFVPDAALVLAVLVLARAEVADLAPLVLLTAFARAATSGEAPIVLVTGILGALLAALALRGALELSGVIGRTLAALVATGACQAWAVLARAARADGGEADALAAWTSAVPVGIASALLALVLGPLLARLPGLAPLRSRAW